jgi:hypothetical protein
MLVRNLVGMTTISDDDLPQGWFLLFTAELVKGYENELALELSPGHYLKGVPVQAVAKDEASDDALFRHTDEPDLWSVVHLTWIGKPERNPFPAVAFTGTFAEFQKAYRSESDSFTRPS